MFPRNQSPRRRVMHENSELTNHDCFANVFRERGFRKFSTAQIGKLLQEEYPNFSLGASCLMTTQKAMPHRAGALGLPSKYSTR
jgi:hypothetical protein